MRKIVEYAVHAGNRDNEIKPPYPGDHGTVCVTDGNVTLGAGWKAQEIDETIKKMGIEMPDDHPLWRVYAVRILPHLIFPKAEWHVYHDANVVLRKNGAGNPMKMIRAMGNAEIGIRQAPKGRKPNLEAEITECERLAIERHGYRNYDAQGQMEHYRKYPKISHKNKRTWCTAIVIRKNTERNRVMNERWWKEVCRWRDIRTQASLCAVLQEMRLHDEVWPVPRECVTLRGHARR